MNGYPFEVGDLVLAYSAVYDPDNYPLSMYQKLAGDVDEDDICITVADLLYFVYFINGEPWSGYPQNPNSDTLIIESALAEPGEQLSLSLYLKTADTLVDFQAYIVSDTDYFTIDSLILNDTIPLIQNNASGFPHLFSFPIDMTPPESSTLIYPGAYHIGDLIGHVNPDIQTPAVTTIEFQNDFEFLAYTGLANPSFFQPVLVDGEITITPTSIDDYTDTGLPSKISITAYPTPFNSSINLTSISWNGYHFRGTTTYYFRWLTTTHGNFKRIIDIVVRPILYSLFNSI